VVSGTDRNVGVSWAPDGTRAAFWRATSDGSALWMLPATASKPVPVTAQQFHPTFGETEVISWSPDGTRVAFGSTPSGNADDPGPSSILVVDVGTGAVTQLPRADLLAADMPTWSRDGTMIAFRGQVDASGAGHRLSVMNADGSRVRRISDALADGFDAVGYGSPTWSPDGRSIVFDAINSSGRTTAFRLYRADLAAGTVSQLTTQPRNAYAPRYSPDGSLVAFTDWQEPVSSLWVMRPDGNGKLDLADGSVSDSSQWSPDGQWILYEGQPANGHDNSLYRIRPDKTGRQVLLDVPSAANPRSGVSWQPVP
jgi:Tol biopolymer transport system component